MSIWSKGQHDILKLLELDFYPKLSNNIDTIDRSININNVKTTGHYKPNKNNIRAVNKVITDDLVKDLSNKTSNHNSNLLADKLIEQMAFTSQNISADKDVLSKDKSKVINNSCKYCSDNVSLLIQSSIKKPVLIIYDQPSHSLSNNEKILLNNILKSINYLESDYHAQPIPIHLEQGSFDPSREQLNICRDYVIAIAELISAELIILFGQISAQSIIKVDSYLGDICNSTYLLNQHQVLTFPELSYLLEMPLEKGQVWQRIQRYLEENND